MRRRPFQASTRRRRRIPDFFATCAARIEYPEAAFQQRGSRAVRDAFREAASYRRGGFAPRAGLLPATSRAACFPAQAVRDALAIRAKSLRACSVCRAMLGNATIEFLTIPT